MVDGNDFPDEPVGPDIPRPWPDDEPEDWDDEEESGDMKCILSMENDLYVDPEASLLAVGAAEGVVHIELFNAMRGTLLYDMDEEEALVVAVALMEGLKVANPVYAEIEEGINRLMDELSLDGDNDETCDEDA